MNIHFSRVNLVEKDIEDWLHKYPEDIVLSDHEGTESIKWVARQYVLPSGIADLIGITSDGYIIVVEVKNVPINKAAITQVARYAYDLSWIAARFKDYKKHPITFKPVILKLLVGPSIDSQTLIEAHALDTEVLTFQTSLQVELFGTGDEVQEQVEERDNEAGRLAFQPEWDSLGARYDNWRTKAEVEAYRESQAGIKGEANPDEYDELMDAIIDGDEEGEESDE